MGTACPEVSMSLIGGTLGIALLNWASRNGAIERCDIATAYIGRSKLEVLLGAGIWDEVRGKIVLDYGCGPGHEVVEIAEHGAAHVVGIDLRPKWLELGEAHAAAQGVSDRCTFARSWTDPVDLIVSLDSFEHFADPASVLAGMRALLKPGGRVVAAFGPTWYHPLGGHVYSVFPFSHLLFSESALVRWRSLHKSDGARSIAESGLNQMTIRRFIRLVEASPLRFEHFELLPIRPLRLVANRVTREFTTAAVRCALVPR
jgi:SAM-dependent methyltransferase